MNMILEYLKTAATESILLILEMSWIIFLVMLVLEILKAFNVLHKINNFTYRFTKYLGISSTANFSLLVGVIIGISYGAGAIINSYRNGDMTKKDVLLVSVFLSICHAIVEDTFLFVKIGANGFIIVIVRLISAIIVTYVTCKYYDKRIAKEEI